LKRKLSLQSETKTENEDIMDKQTVYAEELSDAMHEDTCEISVLSKEIREGKAGLLAMARRNLEAQRYLTKCTCKHAKKMAADQAGKRSLSLDKTQKSVTEAKAKTTATSDFSTTKDE
jgi:Tfp pilus assembly protein PilN